MSRARSDRRLLAIGSLVGALAGCEAVIGADFDVEPAPRSDCGGGGATSTGAPGTTTASGPSGRGAGGATAAGGGGCGSDAP